MDDSQLKMLLGNATAASDRLAADCRYVDAAVVMGLVQAVRALRTRLEPMPEEKPALAVVPEG